MVTLDTRNAFEVDAGRFRGALDWRALVTGRVGLAGVAQAFRDLADPERHAKIVMDPRL